MITSNEAIEAKFQQLAQRHKSKRILDVGCGDGLFTKFFCVNNNKVTGLDLQRLVDEKRIPFKFVQADALSIPFPGSSFDTIVSVDVIEHIEDDCLFLKECGRVLKTGGKIILATPNRHRLSFFLLSILGRKPTYPRDLGKDAVLGDIVHVREYTVKEIVSLFERLNFTVESISTVWFGVAIKGDLQIGLRKAPLSFLSKFGFSILVIGKK